MKFLVKILIPTKEGNAGVKDGSLLQKSKAYFERMKPEALYFGTVKGKRAIFMVVDIDRPERMPSIVEPLWLNWQAEVYCHPVMDAEEFEKAGAFLQEAVKGSS